MTRRDFIRSLSAAGIGIGVGGCEFDDVCRMYDNARIVTRFGVIAHPEVTWITDCRQLEKALSFFRQQQVDAVVITGKITKNGYKNQRDVFEKVWRGVFGKTKVELIENDGRHELKGFAFNVSRASPRGAADEITFHAGGRYALTDDMRFYDRAYNAVFAGSMSGVDVMDGFTYGSLICRDRTLPACQGLLASVYADNVVIRRLDFTQSQPADSERNRNPVGIYAEDVADPLVLPRSGRPARNLGQKPRFWEDTHVQVVPGYAGTERIYTVRWPNLLKRFVGVRAGYYELNVSCAGDDGRASAPFIRHYVLSNNFMLSESRDAGFVTCILMHSELIAGGTGKKLVVSIVPVSTMGVPGDAVRAYLPAF